MNSVNGQIARLVQRSSIDLRQPIFLWGNGQSGSFLLYDILAYAGPFAFPFTRGVRKKGFATQMYGEHPIRMDRKPIEGIQSMWGGSIPACADASHGAITAPAAASDVTVLDLEGVRSRYRDLRRAWPWQHAEPLRVLDKSVNYIFAIELLEAAFPDAVHIFCLRDPRMTLSSILRRFKQPDYEARWQGYPSGFYGNIMPAGYEAYREAPIEVRHAWQIMTVLNLGLDACRQLGPRCIVSRHEDLLADPEKELTRLAAFLGVEIDDGLFPMIRTSLKLREPVSWPSDRSMTREAAALYIDDETIADLAGLNEFAVRLGYDPRLAGKPITATNVAIAQSAK